MMQWTTNPGEPPLRIYRKPPTRRGDAALVLALALGLMLLMVAADRLSQISGLNDSPDGRYHSCGLVTEQGVTSHLNAYKTRCGS